MMLVLGTVESSVSGMNAKRHAVDMLEHGIDGHTIFWAVTVDVEDCARCDWESGIEATLEEG